MIAARVIAHRGASSLAPENTLAALRAAVDVGAAWAEIDTQVLADDTVIVFHDDTLERCTDGRGAVADATWSQVRGLDAGVHFAPQPGHTGVPRLADVLELCRETGLGLNIELKVVRADRREALVDGVLAAVADAGPARDRLLLSSYDAAMLQRLRRYRDDLQLGLICRRVPRDVAAATAPIAAVSLHAECRRLDPPAIDRVHAAGLELYAFTANDPGEVARLWDRGADGVFTDRPQDMLALPGARR